MTTISELFNQRRCRFSRNDVDSGSDSSSVDRISHYRHRNSNSRYHHHHNSRRSSLHDLEACDNLRWSSHLRHPIHRHPSPGLDFIQLDEGSSDSSSGNTVNLDSISRVSGRLRFNGNDRLPGAVILARERLLQRLRGVSLSGNRQNTPSVTHHDDFASLNDSRFVDAGDWEAEILGEQPGGVTPSPESNPRTDRLLVLQGESKQSAGLSQDELDCLHVEIFSSAKTGSEGLMLMASQDCSICLESFMEGDRLICLPCGHRFHSSCLDPWIRTCGDCPNCRTGIVVTSS